MIFPWEWFRARQKQDPESYIITWKMQIRAPVTRFGRRWSRAKGQMCRRTSRTQCKAVQVDD